MTRDSELDLYASLFAAEEAAREAYRAAMRDAVAVAQKLEDEGRQDRLAGFVTAVDLGTSAAFLFSMDYESATNIVREAIKQATREED